MLTAAKVSSYLLRRAMSHVEPHVPKGIPKVKDKLVTLNVMGWDGSKHVITAFIGEPLLAALKRNCVPISHACNGGDLMIPSTEYPLDTTSWGPSCSECQIVVNEPWLKYLKPMGKHEQTRLVRSPNAYFTPRSRLACCILVEKWMDGLGFSLPYCEESRPVGSHSPFDVGENRIHNF